MPNPLVSGDRAPLISLADAHGVERRSEALDGQALVLFFYPKDDTPGCTMEACAPGFRKDVTPLISIPGGLRT